MIANSFARGAAVLLLTAAAVVMIGCTTRNAATVGDMDERIAFHRARAGGPGTYPHHARLGLAYLERARATGAARDLALAERHLQTSLDEQRSFEALLGMAALESHRHRFTRARALAEEALSAVPDSVEARGILVEVYLATDDVNSAADEVDRMLALGPSFDAFAGEAAVFERRGRAREALAAMERACVAATADRRPAGRLAWCDARRGQLLRLVRCSEAGAEAGAEAACRP